MLTVVIPTFEERDNLEPLLKRFARVSTSWAEPLEILIVDGGSQDGTGAQARRLLGTVVPGRVLELPQRVDLAQAVLTGFRYARGDVVGVMDADLSHPPELLPALVDSVRAGSEIAVASRYVPGGGVAEWSWRRRVCSRLANVMTRPLVRVHDATSGYFVCRTARIASLQLVPRGFKILLEILVRGQMRSVTEVPYIFQERRIGTSKFDGKAVRAYLRQLGELYVFHWRGASRAPQMPQGPAPKGAGIGDDAMSSGEQEARGVPGDT